MKLTIINRLQGKTLFINNSLYQTYRPGLNWVLQTKQVVLSPRPTGSAVVGISSPVRRSAPAWREYVVYGAPPGSWNRTRRRRRRPTSNCWQETDAAGVDDVGRQVTGSSDVDYMDPVSRYYCCYCQVIDKKTSWSDGKRPVKTLVVTLHSQHVQQARLRNGRKPKL